MAEGGSGVLRGGSERGSEGLRGGSEVLRGSGVPHRGLLGSMVR